MHDRYLFKHSANCGGHLAECSEWIGESDLLGHWDPQVWSYRRLLWPHREKSFTEKSGDLAGHGMGPSPSLLLRLSCSSGPRCPIHLFPNISVTAPLASPNQWGGAPSCWNHILQRKLSGTSSRSNGSSFRKKMGVGRAIQSSCGHAIKVWGIEIGLDTQLKFGLLLFTHQVAGELVTISYPLENEGKIFTPRKEWSP